MNASRALFLVAFAMASLTGGVGVWMRLVPAAAATLFAGEVPALPRGDAVAGVIGALEDAEAAYLRAAAGAESPAERRVYREAARQRALFAEEVRRLAIRYGGRPVPGRPDARFFSGSADAAERDAAGRYEDALKGDLPFEARAALEGQLHSVRTAAKTLSAAKGRLS